MAYERGLDLVEVAANARPPVCRIIDYGKYLYQQEKKARQSRFKQVEIKGVRLSFGIAKHDLELKAKQAEKFLKEGHKVKIDIILRGREKAHADLAKEKMEIFRQMIPMDTIVDQEPKKQPRGLSMIIRKS